MQSQVCVIHDEHLCFRDASYGRLTERILSNRYPLGKTGAPYDHFLRSDLEKISTAKYKIIWLMGFPELNEKELKNIRKWKRNGITVMWTDTDRTHIFKRGFDDIDINDVVYLSDSQLREIFKNAGVHVYLDSGDVFYIGRNWLCIHSVFGGKKTLRFPFYTQ